MNNIQTPQYSNIPVPQNANPYENMGNMGMPQNDMPTVNQFMYDFNENHREKFNDYWFERNDDDLIEGMKKVILSCQRDKYFILKVLNFEVIKGYSAVNRTLSEYYAARSKNKKSDSIYDNINLRDSDIMLLKVTYYIKLNIPENKVRIDTKTGEPDRTEGTVDVLIALPIYVNKYYFRISGNYYIPVFQIVDGSTYNNSTSNAKTSSITLKTQFMPIKVYKETYLVTDIVDNIERKCTLFASYIFTKKADTIKFILGRYGFYGAMEMLELQGIYIQKSPSNGGEIMNPEMFYNFVDPSDNIMVSVIKKLFDVDNVTQSFCYTLLKVGKKIAPEKFDEIYDPRFWNKQLGADFLSATLDKGIPVLDSLESIYDLETKQSIRLPMEDKEDTYCILRWMMREFSFLKQRDNIDISTKHPRKADEYLPAIYAAKLSTGIYRISDKGKNITFKDVLRVIETAPDYILKNINASNLVDYVDLVNDNDAELALSFTYKGISGLGDQGSGTAVPLIYRSVHPSHLGRIDLDTSSASDPGLSGVICPMAKQYNGSFSNFVEPNGWKDFYKQALDELHSLYGMKEAVEIQKKLGLSYDYVKEDMVKETIETYHRLIPAVIDIEGKKDYTLGAKIWEEDSNSEPIVIKSSSDSDVGDIIIMESDEEEE